MSWDSLERRAEKGPFSLLFGIGLGVLALLLVFGTIGYFVGWFGEGAAVAREQFGPRQSLVKYEWFKDAAAALDAKGKSIDVYAAAMRDMEQQYAGTPRGQWPRDEREAFNQKSVETAGLKASYNDLVRQYNANSAKFNWSYANTEGNLPRTYQEK